MLCERCHVEIEAKEKMDSIKKTSLRRGLPEQEFLYTEGISD